MSMADCETIKPLSQWLCGELRWAFCVLIHLSVGVSCSPKSTNLNCPYMTLSMAHGDGSLMYPVCIPLELMYDL